MNSNLHEKQVNLRDIWQILLKRKWLLILPFFLVVAISYGGTYLMKPKYESKAVILTTRSNLVSGNLARVIPGDFGEVRKSDRQISREMNETRGLVTSGVNLAQVVNRLNLDEDPQTLQKAAEIQKNVRNVSAEDLIYRALIQDLRKRVKVDFVSENMIEIHAEHEDPIMARDIAQTLAEVYVDERLKSDLLAVRRNLEFSNTQAQIYKKELEEKEDALAEFKSNYQKSTIDRGLTTEDNLRDIESEMDRVKLVDKVEANDRLNFLEKELTAKGIDPADLKSPAELDVRKRILMDRTTNLSDLMEKYTWRDPKVNMQRRMVDASLDTIKSVVDSISRIQYAGQIQKNIDLISEYIFTKIELDYYIHKEKRLQASKENIKNSFARGPNAEITLATLEKDVERAKQWYDNFLENYTGSQLAMEVYREEAENRYKIIEPAFVPVAPYWPNRIKITLMGIALGLLIGAGAVILAEVTDNSIKKIETIEDLLGIKVMGTIPRIEFKEGSFKMPHSVKNAIGSES